MLSMSGVYCASPGQRERPTTAANMDFSGMLAEEYILIFCSTIITFLGSTLNIQFSRINFNFSFAIELLYRIMDGTQTTAQQKAQITMATQGEKITNDEQAKNEFP